VYEVDLGGSKNGSLAGFCEHCDEPLGFHKIAFRDHLSKYRA
jgi:hypothetical protein